MKDKLILAGQDYYVIQPSYIDDSNISLTTVSSRSDSNDTLYGLNNTSSSEVHEMKFTSREQSIIHIHNENRARSKPLRQKINHSSSAVKNPYRSRSYSNHHSSLREGNASEIINSTAPIKTLDATAPTHHPLDTITFSNRQMRKDLNENSSISQDLSNRHIFQNKTISHKNSSSQSKFQLIKSSRRSMKSRRSLSVEQEHSSFQTQHTSFKHRILNLFRFNV